MNAPFLHLSLSGMFQEFRPVILKGTPIQTDQEVIILSTSPSSNPTYHKT